MTLRYGEAELLYKKALQLTEEVLGPKHPDTLTSSNNLALLYQFQGRYGEAELLYKKALQLTEEVLGPKHPLTLTSLLNYSVCLINMKREKKALSLLKTLEVRSLSRAGSLLYTTLKGRVRRKFLFSASNFQNMVFTLAKIHKTSDITRFASNVMLRWKQIQSEEEAYMAHLVQTSPDPEIKLLGEKIMGLRTQLTMSFRTSAGAGGSEKAAQILIELESAELELAKISKKYKAQLEVYGADIEKVRSNLPQSSALIELRKYWPFDFKTGEFGEPHWAGVLVRPGAEGENLFFEDLGPVEETMKLWKHMRSAADVKKANQYSAKLYQNLFGKFKTHIKDINRIYIAPDGFLNLISFAGLILPDGRYWAQSKDLRRLQTGRDLLGPQREENSGSLLAVGGVDFDTYPKQAKAAAEDTFWAVSYGAASNKWAAEEIKTFKPLPYSKDEVDEISAVYKICRKVQPQVLKGDGVGERVLKRLAAAPRVLHLSTHGFYLSASGQVERPLVLSGLALAGANQGLEGKVGPDGEDGILYGLEILGLNLRGAALVSLSACDTGKGLVDYSEGVYGLVKAFRIAGAHSVLMTLWSVDDKESMEFMTLFYRNWLQQPRGDPAKALRKTQLAYINNENTKHRDPKVWAPYVLVGK